MISTKISAKKSDVALFFIGKCKSNDIWPMCTGGCNMRTVGGICNSTIWFPHVGSTNHYNCGENQISTIQIKCYGEDRRNTKRATCIEESL